MTLLRLGAALVASSWLAGCGPESRLQVVGELVPGETVQGALPSPRPPVYRVAVTAGEFARLTLQQKGVDVVAVLLDTAGRELLSVDSPNGEHGPEHLYFVAERSGDYFFEARPFDGRRAGAFTIQRESRPATEMDRVRAEACHALHEADVEAGGEGVSRRDALRHYTQAIEGWRRAGERYQEAMSEAKLGKALFALGEERSATHHWERALTLFQSLGIDSQEPALRNQLGVAYERLEEADLARSSFAAARKSAQRRRNRHEETAAINNLGTLEKDAGEPWRALVLFEEALAGWRELKDARGEATTLHNLGTLYTVVGKLPEAQASLEEALNIRRSLGRPDDEAATQMALAWVRFLQGDASGARADLLSSLDLRRRAVDRRGEAGTLDRLGTLSRETGELDRAASEYQQALAILDELGEQQSKARVLINLGETLTEKGLPGAGLHYHNLALQVLEGQGQPSVQAYARFRRARAQRALGQLEAAWLDMRHALSWLEGIRERAVSDDFRMSYFDSVHELYEFAVDLLMEIDERHPGDGYDRQAFDMSERARARGLLDFVQEARGRRSGESLVRTDEGLRRLEKEIREAETRQAALVAGVGQRGAAADEEAGVRRLLQEREKALVRKRLAQGEQGLSALPLGIADIQRLVLDGETVLLVYFLGEDRSFVWAIEHRAVESAVLPPRGLIEAAAVRYHGLLARSHLGTTEKQLRLTAKELSAVLLGSVAQRLRHRRIVVVADGALAYVPFGALPDPASHDELLSLQHEVVTVPSASVVAALRERAAQRARPAKLVVVVADPIFSRGDPRVTPGLARVESSGVPSDVTRSANDLGFRSLGRLPFSRREAEAILSLAGRAESLGVTDFAANLALVEGGGLEHFRIVHFATHALVHPLFPELSGVVLSLVDEDGTPRPGFLRTYQIVSSKLPADLVVLSACRTGLGVELHGEGLVGLTQSFFHAGASRVVVSLWDVDDEATARLMETFYREMLVGGRSPAAALRAAQLAMRADLRWGAPYYWAGFVLQGDWR